LSDIVDTTKILVRAAEKIYKSISEAKALKILNQELFIKVPEGFILLTRLLKL